MIKAFIFDVFGVIYPQAVGQYFKEHPNVVEPDFLEDLNLKVDLGMINRDEFFSSIEKASGTPAHELKAEIDRRWVPDNKLVDIIKLLKKKYKLGILSNAGKEEIDVLYRDQLDNLFDSITVSYDTGLVKPDPKIYLVAADRLKVKLDECLLIDDSVINLEGAKTVGMQTLLYPRYGVLPKELVNM